MSADAPDRASALSVAADGVRVRIRVQPRAARDGVRGLWRDPGGGVSVRIAVTAAATDGKANAAVLAMLAREWRLPKSRLGIHAGLRDRVKVIAVAGDPPALTAMLDGWFAGLDVSAPV